MSPKKPLLWISEYLAVFYNFSCIIRVSLYRRGSYPLSIPISVKKSLTGVAEFYDFMEIFYNSFQRANILTFCCHYKQVTFGRNTTR